ncbi:oleosin-B6-like [Penaeus japonicus]|uniref:oleosin-B6-like n=1 Tax=Penaeus japonicus TaxID=27405 RepID=UPI001C715D66|nr:oleosin-B6-like [Penaeus japonicus]XP_042891153.1 oleosin-B6-like [Penaeus japonicus]
MKAAVVFCFAASLAVAAALPPPGGFGGFAPPAPAGPFAPSPAMIAAFIPTPEEIQALNALHTTPAPGAVPAPAVAPGTPTAPPTMPPAVANLVKKYQAAAAAFMPPAAGAV